MVKNRTCKKTYPKEVDIARMLRTAIGVCRQVGYPVDDPEYGSAIGEGVLDAANNWKPGEFSCTPTTLASIYAKRRCAATRRALRVAQEKGLSQPDFLSTDRSTVWKAYDKESLQPVELPEVDLALLEFVATYGIAESSKLLEMSRVLLRERLDGIKLRVVLQRLDL